MTRTIIDIHVLQTVPPSNINRDDTGSPKTAIYGGVQRARVSSQAWKRATRKAFESLVDPASLGVRTKRLVELVEDVIIQRSSIQVPLAGELAKQAINEAGIKTKLPKKNAEREEPGYLVFLSRSQIEALADTAIKAAAEDDPAKFLKGTGLISIANRQHSIDIALFGRMVADKAELNVDASAQVAHALSVHTVNNEYDYFTAVDDQKDNDSEADAGAGMIGTVEFNSSTLYRYATVDVDLLRDNLGDDKATVAAVAAFVRAFVTAMPTGKQNTFANRTVPDAVLVTVRATQPINLVGAFEVPVGEVTGQGRVTTAAQKLVAHAKDINGKFCEEPDAAWGCALAAAATPFADAAELMSFDQLVSGVSDTVAERLGQS